MMMMMTWIVVVVVRSSLLSNERGLVVLWEFRQPTGARRHFFDIAGAQARARERGRKLILESTKS